VVLVGRVIATLTNELIMDAITNLMNIYICYSSSDKFDVLLLKSLKCSRPPNLVSPLVPFIFLYFILLDTKFQDGLN